MIEENLVSYKELNNEQVDALLIYKADIYVGDEKTNIIEHEKILAYESKMRSDMFAFFEERVEMYEFSIDNSKSDADHCHNAFRAAHRQMLREREEMRKVREEFASER